MQLKFEDQKCDQSNIEYKENKLNNTHIPYVVFDLLYAVSLNLTYMDLQWFLETCPFSQRPNEITHKMTKGASTLSMSQRNYVTSEPWLHALGPNLWCDFLFPKLKSRPFKWKNTYQLFNNVIHMHNTIELSLYVGWGQK